MWGGGIKDTYHGSVEKQKKVWQTYNEFMIYIHQQKEGVNDYENVFKIGKWSAFSKGKLNVIQSTIQVEWPTNWSIENIVKTANKIKWLELYNAKNGGKLEDTESKGNIIKKTQVMLIITEW
jgi:hypothetical protein